MTDTTDAPVPVCRWCGELRDSAVHDARLMISPMSAVHSFEPAHAPAPSPQRQGFCGVVVRDWGPNANRLDRPPYTCVLGAIASGVAVAESHEPIPRRLRVTDAAARSGLARALCDAGATAAEVCFPAAPAPERAPVASVELAHVRCPAPTDCQAYIAGLRAELADERLRFTAMTEQADHNWEFMQGELTTERAARLAAERERGELAEERDMLRAMHDHEERRADAVAAERDAMREAFAEIDSAFNTACETFDGVYIRVRARIEQRNTDGG